MILNVGCGGRPGDKRASYGDVRIDVKEFPNVTHVMDVHVLPPAWEGRFIEIVCETALEHFESPRRALSGMARVLAPGGRIIVVVPNVHYWRRLYRSYRADLDVLNGVTNPPDHKQAWDLVEMRNLAVQCGLVITSYDFLDWLPEKKRAPILAWKRWIVRRLPHFMRMTEVRFILRALVNPYQ